MLIYKLQDMLRGWFCGNFEPSAFRSKDFEVGYLSHNKGEKWPAHYHKLSTEINLLVSGKMTVNGILLNPGDIFVIEPGKVSEPIFLEDCKIVCIKTPSVPGDKYE